MEIDLSNRERSDQVTWATDDQDLFGHARSFSCSFCKRGFSNAQALGGHMNIHRKDRARLKEFASLDNNLLSMDITKRDDDPPPPSVDSHDTELQFEFCRDETSCTTKRASSSSDQEIDHDHDPTGDQLPLSLFPDSSSSKNDKVESNRDNRYTKRSMQLSHGESLPELDLELRLGPEPHEASTKRS